jgi:serine/threonine protein kinase/Flp pilus assembly protein TadD
MTADDHNNGQTKPFKVLVAGTVIKNYRIISRIGRGGMGEVYLALDQDLNRKTALKFLLPHICEDETCRSRFKREARASAKLDHSNIVTIYEVDEYCGRPFFAMQYVQGMPLDEYCKTNNVTFDELIDIVCQICDGLHSAHQSGIVHRDIKPSNIIIDKKGRAKIFDFGLATIQGTDKLTEPGSALGTIGYISPEQLQMKKVDQRTDLFSLGVVMYEIIAGRAPFRGSSRAAVMNSIINETPEPLSRYKSNVPQGLNQIVFKLLQKDPNLRYQAANEVISDLKLLQSETSLGKPGLSGKKAGHYSLFRRPLTKFVFGPMLLILAAILLFSPATRDTIFRTLGLYSVPIKKHIAVLPFLSIPEDESTSALNDGLLEILTAKLSQLEAFHGKLQVIPASEIRRNRITSAGEARQAFGATLAITGSLHIISDSVELLINLVDAKKERLLRSADIQSRSGKVSSIQDSALFAIARMLDIYLKPEDKTFLAAGGTRSQEAYYYYLEGLGHIHDVGNPQQLDSAIYLLSRAIEKDDDFALAYSALGMAYWDKYKFAKDSALIESARVSCRHALKLNPRLAKPHVALGNIYSEFREADKAINEFNIALSIDSTNNLAYKGLAKTYEMKNEMQRAESIYKKVINMRPDYPSAYFDLAWFYLRQARMQDAALMTQKILDLKPEGFTDWNNLGALYYSQGQYEKAGETWEHSLEIQPNYGAYSNLGALHFIKSEYRQAARMYEEALRLNDSDYRVWLNLADVYKRFNPDSRADSMAFMRAIQMAEHQKKINPRDPEVLSHLSEAYATMNMHDKAIENIQEALSLSPNNVNYYISAGLVYELAGRRDEAVYWIKKALDNGIPPERIENTPEFDSLITDPEISEYLATGKNISKQ